MSDPDHRSPEPLESVPELPEALRRYEAQWRALHPGGTQGLLPGLDPATVTQRLGEHGLPAPQEILDWYGWHDGARGIDTGIGDDDGWMPSIWNLLSLDGALSRRESQRELARDLAEDDEEVGAWFWGPDSWLPILRRNDSHVVADLRPGSAVVRLHFWVSYLSPEERAPASPSIAAVIDHWTDVAESCVHWDAEAQRPTWHIDASRRPPLPASIPSMLW